MACTLPRLSDTARRPLSVAGRPIPHAAIAREVQNHRATTPIEAWNKAKLALVVRAALLAEVERTGIVGVPREDGAGRRETQNEADMRALVETRVSVPDPTRDECLRYYEANPARFRAPSLFEAAHILISADSRDRAAYDTARLDARTLIDELSRDADMFGDLARLRSACPSREFSGHLGQIRSGETTPAFEAALERMEEGTIGAQPVETPYGVHVIRLDRRSVGALLPFDAVEDRIRAYLRARVAHTAKAQFVARLLAQTPIEGLEIPTPADLNLH